jgi:hypothetical protein
MGSPLDVSRIAPLIGTKEDKAFLKRLPKRKGNKPTIGPFAIRKHTLCFIRPGMRKN